MIKLRKTKKSSFVSVPALATVQQLIARITNRVFVDQPICSIQFTSSTLSKLRPRLTCSLISYIPLSVLGFRPRNDIWMRCCGSSDLRCGNEEESSK
ncbi:hypothetical protein K435DRAFT_309484 [Dendrothele bispora CBS 962.96]|uniref:Uncharacterized protein n=1 Tax=Dendrothele bispora (strain CBS 962.96) TaxID=1314807 RepID=A0A4S8MLE3_DENBC|nr:hypothetical protein K435DRAFT_309484 [Dendrothele bispora CBS 962.96]